MPELLTKHPEVTIHVLESQGARCGPGQEPAILTACPPARFCKLQGGELCVLGLDQVDKATQISAEELAQHVCFRTEPPRGASGGGGCSIPAGIPEGSGVILVSLLIGTGVLVARIRGRRSVRAASRSKT